MTWKKIVPCISFYCCLQGLNYTPPGRSKDVHALRTGKATVREPRALSFRFLNEIYVSQVKSITRFNFSFSQLQPASAPHRHRHGHANVPAIYFFSYHNCTLLFTFLLNSKRFTYFTILKKITINIWLGTFLIWTLKRYKNVLFCNN